MHKKIEQEGETIFVSAGFEEDMDPESLLQETELSSDSLVGEESILKEEQGSLFARVDLHVAYCEGGLQVDAPLNYKGLLRSQKIDYGATRKQLDLTMSLQDALELFEFAECRKWKLRAKYSIDYVFKQKNTNLQKQQHRDKDLMFRTIQKIELNDIKNSTCLCSIELTTMPL